MGQRDWFILGALLIMAIFQFITVIILVRVQVSLAAFQRAIEKRVEDLEDWKNRLMHSGFRGAG